LELRLHQVSVMPGKRNILRDVSLSLFEGLTFVAGLNGSGKSTLLRAISGLVPFQGSIFTGSENLGEMKPRQRAAHIALLHQRISQGFAEEVFHFVRMGRFPHTGWLDTYGAEDDRRATEALALVGTSDLANRLTDSLSGGELQKVLIARALCQDAQVLLLDEPTQYLDPKNAALVNDLIRRVAAMGRIVVCVTHDTQLFQHPGARLIGLRDGSLVLDIATGPAALAEVNEKVYGL
jgi:iron complex transport system ATP-binding protein